ncbi:hypothetical protein OUZ56_021630 [Daphnia magna]|uniref:Uncharacterized protein n=1 Tax=Daphnia magna TaxID=35525 RepID=A0ABR0AU30_9CRUS|nr:hypothetical protein OUZ56_021630 [Daphnia magna]
MTCFKKPPLAITAADLPMSIDVQPTAVTNPSQSTASASAAVPPRRTRPRQPRPPHTTQEGEAFLPRFISLHLFYCLLRFYLAHPSHSLAIRIQKLRSPLWRPKQYGELTVAENAPLFSNKEEGQVDRWKGRYHDPHANQGKMLPQDLINRTRFSSPLQSSVSILASYSCLSRPVPALLCLQNTTCVCTLHARVNHYKGEEKERANQRAGIVPLGYSSDDLDPSRPSRGDLVEQVLKGLNAVRQNMTTTPVRVQVPGLNLQQEIGSSIRYTSTTCLTHSVATPSRSGT